MHVSHKNSKYMQIIISRPGQIDGLMQKRRNSIVFMSLLL